MMYLLIAMTLTHLYVAQVPSRATCVQREGQLAAMPAIFLELKCKPGAT